MTDAPRHVLVTGGGRGIGAAVCRGAGARGWRVTVNYAADASAAEATAEAVTAAGGAAVSIGADVADADAVTRLFDQAEAALGPIGAVVVNAGILDLAMPLAEMDPARIRRIVDVNVTGALLTAREAARRLSRGRGGKGGALVIVSSVAARLGAPGASVDYAASKGAMDTLAIGLGRELAPEGVRVNAVRPGLIETDIHASGGEPGRAQRLASSIPAGRPGSADEVAEAVLWLLSDAASYVTGAVLDVSGGR